MESDCSSFDRELVDYRPRSFRNSDMLLLGQRGIPRFGFSSGIEKTVNGNVDEAASYVTGVVVCSLCIFSFFVCWVITLILLRCFGPRRVGIYSGVRLPIPKRPEHSETYVQEMDVNGPGNDWTRGGESIESFPDGVEQEKFDLDRESYLVEKSETESNAIDQSDGKLQSKGALSAEYRNSLFNERLTEWETSVKRHERQLRRIRIAVLVCGSLVVASVLTMIFAGIMNLSDASSSMTKGLNKARNLALSGVLLIEEFLSNQNLFIRNIQSYRATMNGFCPQVSETVCESLSPISNCKFESFSEQVRGFLWDIYIDLSTYVFFELRSVQKDLVNVAKSMSSLQEGVNGFTWAFWTACVWAILLMIFTMFLMYGVILAWRDARERNCFQCIIKLMHHWLVVPLYISFVFLTWVFSMIFVIGTVLTADFCYDSPDGKVLATIDANREKFSTLVAEFVIYYVSGCPDSGLPTEMKVKSDQLIRLLLSVSNFGAVLQSDEITELCGDSSGIRAVGSSLEAATCALVNTLLDVQEYFACQNFHPVYESTVYEGLCYEANRGLTWVAFTQILIVFFSMIMLMLRVAFMEEDDNKNENSGKPWIRLSILACLRRRRSTNDEFSQERVNEAIEIEFEGVIAEESNPAKVPDTVRFVDAD